VNGSSNNNTINLGNAPATKWTPAIAPTN